MNKFLAIAISGAVLVASAPASAQLAGSLVKGETGLAAGTQAPEGSRSNQQLRRRRPVSAPCAIRDTTSALDSSRQLIRRTCGYMQRPLG